MIQMVIGKLDGTQLLDTDRLRPEGWPRRLYISYAPCKRECTGYYYSQYKDDCEGYSYPRKY
jgi:hypothetical protein